MPKHFNILIRDVTRPLREFLQDHGVWVRNKRTYSIAKSLYECTQSEKNIWLDDNHNSANKVKTEQGNKNNAKDSSNTRDIKTELSSPNPTNYNPNRTHPDSYQSYIPPGQIQSSSTQNQNGRDISNLVKC
ncbi:hypothetical protein GcM3_090027 [Golovinomyces cichoracearum]|uniref:Uncharacterized protein n=1 Tax=Golovinomyces cichoracearum TaxID=62708 RepID=A0A420IHX2_9PEZI|nr:hypothetical protein GcM3_090027 [Golovinomyces cichoracearum]